MKTIKDNLSNLILESVKFGDNARTTALRLIKTEFINFEKTGKTLTEQDEINILLKLEKRYEDTINVYKNAGRTDLAEKEMNELNVVKEFIPKQPTEEDIRKRAELYLSVLSYTPTMAMMKQLSEFVKEEYPTADNKIIVDTLKKWIGK